MGEHMLTLAAELRERYTLTFVCPPTEPGRALLRRAAALGLETFTGAARADGPAWARLKRWLTARRFALFHAHAGIGWEGQAGCRAARDAGIPAVVRTEHLPDLITTPHERWAYERGVVAVDRTIAVSDAASASFLRAGVPAAKLRTIRNGIPPPGVAPDRATARRALGASARDRLILTVGRMTPQKGHATLLAAAPRVLTMCPNASFLWAGEGPLQPELRLGADELRLTDQVRFLGQCGDVQSLYAAADLFVLPSRFEGLPLALLEAMAAGLPVVGTCVCGTEEAVLDGVTGRLVPGGDSEALAEAIVEALSDPAKAARWGDAGRRRVAEHFTASRMARETAALYEELLTAARQPGVRPGSTASPNARVGAASIARTAVTAPPTAP